MNETPQISLYEAAGGEPAFRRLVHRFYQEVAADPELRPVYPSRDLGPAEEHLRLFLIQYWGGPGTYSERRGHHQVLPELVIQVLRQRQVVQRGAHVPQPGIALGLADREMHVPHP